ncbi:uncharacterized protein LOC130589902 [Beta vulgaris subsp. vulgaris]|uniref:uncharacterized protein LOC130589902 n=1 Tax=Beta vulgaris subsp. vulgaris TaxID=3555 RepID=UPI00254946F4|nr:uncharacterized protein LOC130589902 [Beta vulgaris subsp. vulgaris]
MRVDAAAYYLVEDADIWWTHNKFDLTTKVTVDEEGEELMEEREFGWTEFKKELARFAKGLVPDEQERAVKFEEKLDPDLHSRMGAGEYATVKEVYTRACNAERIEEKRLAAKKLKSTPAGSTQATKSENHPGKDCDGNLVECNHCGRKGHRAYEWNAAPNRNGGTANATQGHRGDVRRNTGQVHVMNQTEANTKGNVVTGTFSIHSMSVYVLFDSGASHSFVSELLVKKLGLENSRTCDVDISIPSGVIITCNNLYPDVPIMCGSTTLVADLIAFPLHDFDVILGMDWLSRHKAKIDCEKQKVSVVGPSGVHEFYRGSSLKIISALTLKSYLRRVVYLCHVHDTSKEEPRVEDVRIANEFVDVFPDDIPGMPPRRDVEFSVDLMPGTGPISKPPYRMVLLK